VLRSQTDDHFEIATDNCGKPVLWAPVALAEPVGSQVIVHLDPDALQLDPRLRRLRLPQLATRRPSSP
jgi:hypothetical protein